VHTGDFVRIVLYIRAAMDASARRARAMVVLATSIVALAAWPSVASGDVSLKNGKIDGTTSSSSPPGGVLPAQVQGVVSSGTWAATGWAIGDESGCYNHTDYGPSPDTRTVNFQSNGKNTVTAPGQPTRYDVVYTAYTSNNCSGAAGVFGLTDALNVTAPAQNPDLTERCGIDLMLVLDESGSIASSGATGAVRDATKAFLGALSGTGSSVSIIDFSTNAGRPIGYTVVTPESISGTFNPYIDNTNGNGYNPSGWTNWEAAFQEVGEANGQGTLADLVVFMTDGDPTARNTDSGGTITGLTEGDVGAMRRAEEEANEVKGQGSHVFALGVGAAVNNARSAHRLTAVSGFEQYPGNPFGESDFTLEKDFAQLAAALRQIVLELCESSVTVTKQVDEGDGIYRPDPGWEFTGSVSTSQGGYGWVLPAPPPDTGPRTETTNEKGIATFQWDTSNASARSTFRISEELQDGYDFVDATCKVTEITRRRSRVVRTVTLTTPVGEVTVGPNQYASCTVRNRIRPGTIEIEKNATPESSQAFNFTGSLGIGDFTLVDNRADENASRIFANLGPGTYTVSELVPDNWELTRITCTPQSGAVVAGSQVTITLGAGGAVVCTYVDTRIDPPPPPEPPVPPPSPPAPPGPPIPPEPPAATELRVVKTMPRVTRVGRRVPFRLTVTNTGSVAARDVKMTDVPPASVALASLRASGRPRMGQGFALWRLGRLAPGATRTIRGTVRIQGGSPGLKRNWVFVAAVNARLAQDRADTRLRARRGPACVVAAGKAGIRRARAAC
jgi:uncharacterized repeat protein (TIGR01451 family)